MGAEHDVFSLGKEPAFIEKYIDKNVSCVFLLPSLDADIKIITSQNTEPHAASLAAARFLRDVRGLPLSEITVECANEVYTTVIKKDGRSYIMAKKYLREGYEEINAFDCKVKSEILKCPYGKIRLTRVYDVSEFCDGLLPDLCFSDKGENVIGAVAYEIKGSVTRIKFHFIKYADSLHPFISAMATASSVLSLGISELYVRYNEQDFVFVYENGKMFVSDDFVRPKSFFAPNID